MADREAAENESLQENEDDSLQAHSNSTTHHRLPFSQLNCLETLIQPETLSPNQVIILENCIRRWVEELVKSEVNSCIQSILPRISNLSYQIGKEGIDIGSEKVKLKLFFQNQTASNIFTDKEIVAQNGESLTVAICDTTNSNAIVKTGPLSSISVEFVVLKGEFSSGGGREQTSWSRSDFDKSIVTNRWGKRPLIVGNDGMKVCLKNGVGTVKGLSFSDNSSWEKSKKFRLGARVADEEILTKFSRIEEAVSEPIRVKDHRGEVYKKLHPPRESDDIWRLEGIGKDGAYYHRLSSNQIKTVDDFLKTYHQKGSDYLKKILGDKVSQNTWQKMLKNALECDSVGNEGNFNENLQVDGEQIMNLSGSNGEVQAYYSSSSFNPASRVSLIHQNLEEDSPLEAVGEGFPLQPEFGDQLADLVSNPPSPQQHLGGSYEAMGGQGSEEIMEQDNHYFILDDDYQPLLPYGEYSTLDSYNQEGRYWNGMEPKTK